MAKNGAFTSTSRTKNNGLALTERQLFVQKAGTHPRNLMLCVWWIKEGIVYYELPLRNVTITAKIDSLLLKSQFKKEEREHFIE